MSASERPVRESHIRAAVRTRRDTVKLEKVRAVDEVAVGFEDISFAQPNSRSQEFGNGFPTKCLNVFEKITQNMGRWRSWLSHLSNTQKVLSSNLGRLNIFAPSAFRELH